MLKTAGAIATELRRIADALDKEPETKLMQPLLSFYNYENKGGRFSRRSRLLPRPPLWPRKGCLAGSEYELKANGPGLSLRTVADRSCHLHHRHCWRSLLCMIVSRC